LRAVLVDAALGEVVGAAAGDDQRAPAVAFGEGRNVSVCGAVEEEEEEEEEMVVVEQK